MKRLQHLFCFMFFVLGVTIMAQDAPVSEQDSIMEWSPDKRLQWTDYKGKRTNTGTIANALTSYKINVVPEVVLVDENGNMVNFNELTVVAHFYRYKSWRTGATTQLLHHERLHFDIAELFARKIRRRFSELKASGESNFDVYQSEYTKLWQACRAFQKKFDSETGHGVNTPQNTKWITKVVEELIQLEPYALD